MGPPCDPSEFMYSTAYRRRILSSASCTLPRRYRHSSVNTTGPGRIYCASCAGRIDNQTGRRLCVDAFRTILLFGMKSADPLVVGTAVTVFVGASLTAGGLPAHRAAAIDPMKALKHD